MNTRRDLPLDLRSAEKLFQTRGPREARALPIERRISS